MDFDFIPMTPDLAREVSLWSYPPPYDVYDARGTTEAIEEYLSGAYYAATEQTEGVVGFVCFGTAAQVPSEDDGGAYRRADLLDIGLGLCPDWCGRGQGSAFLRACLSFGRAQHHPAGFRLTVATFNRRAIAVYTRAGFQRGVRFLRTSDNGTREFLVMILAEP
jgi:GNAT superfamily N-acetyltransferase